GGAKAAPEAGPTSAAAAGRVLLYRADMDALPLKEENEVAYRSQNDGVMHACGHDAHVAIALAVARRLAEERDQWRGHLKFALQPVVSRNVSPLDSAVVTVGKITGGTAFNVIAGTAELRGTVRTFNQETHASIPQMFERVVRGVCESMGAGYALDYQRQTPPLVNNAEVCELVAECAAEVLGDAGVIRDDSVRTMGGEDMSYFLERVPGCYFFLGTRNEARGLTH